jgi:hypothetical protein
MRRRRGVFVRGPWALAWLGLVVCAAPLEAQAPAPTLVFVASADHATVVGTTPVVTGYQLDVLMDTGNGALAFTRSLGKPVPNAQQEITTVIPEFLGRANGIYVARVSAQGPGGTSASQPSDPFPWVGQPPAPPGKPSMRSAAP